MNHQKHSYVMIGLLIIGAGLFFSGIAGGRALFLLWPLACVGMMGFMMWGMSRGQGSDQPTHDDPPDQSSAHSPTTRSKVISMPSTV